MSNFFSNNTVWKTASLISALILWLFVINTQNPLQPYDMRNQSISIRGTELLVEKGYVIKNETELRDQKVRVIVKGPRLQIEKVRSNPDLVDVRIDLTKYVNNISADMDMVVPMVPVDISVPLGLTIVEQSPQNLEVTFEREKSVTKPVHYVINKGSNKEYDALTPKIIPGEIEVWGAESYTNNISQVRVDIDMDDFSEDVLTYEVPIKIYDVDGEELTELRQSHKSAEVTLPIGKKKTVPLEMQFVGKLPEGFMQTGVAMQPKNITIIGRSALIDEISSIKLSEISLEDIYETSKINTKFLLPKGVSYLETIDDYATVTLQIKEQALYDYYLDLSKPKINTINTQANLKYEVLSDEVKVKVKSIAENLLRINEKDIVVDIDVQGYGPGEYEVPITLKFPPDVLMMEKPTVAIKVTDNNS